MTQTNLTAAELDELFPKAVRAGVAAGIVKARECGLLPEGFCSGLDAVEIEKGLVVIADAFAAAVKELDPSQKSSQD